jgi:xanthine dehydrogenase accessory factor
VTKEIRNIIKAFDEACENGMMCCLATVVHVEGSSYRRPGARMLVREDGQLTGAISGGCLEGDALRKALLALNQQQNKLVTYDTSDEEDATIGVQLGCNGIIHILFEPIDPSSERHPINLLKQASAQRSKAVLVTLFSLKEREQIGTQFLLFNDNSISKNVSDNLPRALFDDVTKVMESETPLITSCAIKERTISAFIEYLAPEVKLVIIGAGNDAIPLTEMANVLGWNIVVLDGRSNYAAACRFPKANKVIVAKPREVLTHMEVDQQTVFLLLTHNYNYDSEVLSLLLHQQTRYIGILGPKKKHQRMLEDLEEKGHIISQEQRSKIYGPCGLDIGAEAPEEIALSILSEIKAVLSSKQGTLLRDKEGPIHTDVASVLRTS